MAGKPVIPRNRLLYCAYPDTDESLPGSRLILLDGSRRAITSQQGVIEAVGSGGPDAEGDFVPMDPRLTPGTWILHAAFKRTPAQDDNHFWIHEEDVLAVLEVA